MKAFTVGALLLPALLLAGAPIAVSAQTNNPGAVNFNGVDGFIQMPAGVWFNADFTIEGWVYVRSYQNWSRLIDFADGPSTNNVYLALTDGVLGFPTAGVFTNNSGDPTFSSTSQLPTNQWVHLAESAQGTNGTIYINGNAVGNGRLNIAPNVVRSNNYVGRSAYAQDGYANAIFDELRIWSAARNPFQIQTFMSQSLLGPQTNLVGYWRFDDNTGTQASDSSGHSNPGTLQGGTTWTNFSAPISPGFGTALSFDGTNQSVTISHQPALNAFPLTVLTWFKAPTNSFRGGLVNKYVSASHNGYQLFMAGGDLQGWYFRDSTDSVSGALDAGAVNDGKWHHAAFVVDTNGEQLYLDGVLKATNVWNGTPGPTTTTAGVCLGFYQGDSFWPGQLDEVSIWNAALSPAQIHSAAIQGLAGTEPNLLAYYRLDEGSGTFTADSSTNHFDGTVTSSNQWVASFPPLAYSAQTISASLLSVTSESLAGSVVPIGLDTTAWFQFGPSTNYGSVTASTNWTDGYLAQRNVSLVATGLLANADYHYQLVCSNSAGIRVGADQVFSSARNIFVTSLADSGPGSLRQALATAQNFDTIFLTNGVIVLSSGELLVSNTVSIVGINPATTAISGNKTSRVFNILSRGNVSLSFITIENGRPPDSGTTMTLPGQGLSGGGIYNLGTLTIDHCVIMNNEAGLALEAPVFYFGGRGGNGGGIWNGGTLFLSRSTLYNNSGGTGGKGGGGLQGVEVIADIVHESFGEPGGEGGQGGSGGAIANVGTATILQCSLIANSGGTGGAGGTVLGDVGGDAGGGGDCGAILNQGRLTVIASTLVQNSPGRGGAGGGGGGASFYSTQHITFAGSSVGATSGYGIIGGIGNFQGISATLQDTVMAQNPTNGVIDIEGVFNSGGHNFIGSTGGGNFGFSAFGDQVGYFLAPLDPKVMLVANYGGVTPTCELLPGSPLKDAGDDGLLNSPYSLATDQRDRPRLIGAHVDIGAVESSFAAPTAVTLPVTPAQDPGHVSWTAMLEGSVNPGDLQTPVYFQFGLTTNYGVTAPAGVLSFPNNGNNFVSAAMTNLSNGLTYHYRVAATNSVGIVFGGDQSFQTLIASSVPGDINGDGMVDSSELTTIITHLHTNGIVLRADLDLIQSNYWLNASEIRMTNVAGLGKPLVTFALTNFIGEDFGVEYSSNLVDWVPLGRTSPFFQFTDTNAPAGQRYYRLRWP